MKNNSSTLIPSSKIHRWYCPYTLAIYNHIFRANAISTESRSLKKKKELESQTGMKCSITTKDLLLKKNDRMRQCQ